MIPLVIDDDVRVQIKTLRELAEANPVDMLKLSERIKTVKGKRHHMAQMTRQTIEIPMAYAVTFSIEHGHPVGVCRHLSMSVALAGRVPNPDALWMIATELGFWGSIFQVDGVWEENLKGHGMAINIVQRLKKG